MEGKEEPPSNTFNIDLRTGDVTRPVVFPVGAPVLVQNPPASLPDAGQMLPPLVTDVPFKLEAFSGKAKAPGKVKVKETPEKNSEEYIRRRQRNNVAVKKSREKTREKSAYTAQKVEQLKAENEQLESKISTLTKELSVLKSLFMDHARGLALGGNSSLNVEQVEPQPGCKVVHIRENEAGPSSSSNTGSSCLTKSSEVLSTIQPLITAAEIELSALECERTETATRGQTQQDISNEPFAIFENGEEINNYGARGS